MIQYMYGETIIIELLSFYMNMFLIPSYSHGAAFAGISHEQSVSTDVIGPWVQVHNSSRHR